MKLITKLVTALTLMAYSMSAWANINGQYSVLLKFSSGEQVQYNKIPGDTQVEVLVFRIMQDFPQYDLQRDLVDAQVIQTAHAISGQSGTPNPMSSSQTSAKQEVGFWDSGWGTVAKIVITGVVLAALVKEFGVAGASNPCDFTWQTAKDGSRCGGRAASVRPGGRY